MGAIQLPELILKMDAETRFSWRLLGRAHRDKLELVTAYAALLVNGSNLSAKSIAMMSAGLTAEQITATLHVIESSNQIRAANAAVVEFMLRHKVVGHWESEAWASPDMMSLETSRRLHNFLTEPRLKTSGVGPYTHASGRWGILYDRPIVLGMRQAGHAIEGYLRQYSETLHHLAVDTHGYTNFAIGLAKLLQARPVSKNSRSRREKIADALWNGSARDSETRDEVHFPEGIHKGLRRADARAASVKDGTLTAILACQKFGSDAGGVEVCKAGDQLRQLLRTLFLRDYYTRPTFRRELRRVLNRGEAVNVLQRAIYSGRMPHQKGRTNKSLEAISGSLTLLTNLVMTWTTQQIQLASDRLLARNIAAPPGVLRTSARLAFGMSTYVAPCTGRLMIMPNVSLLAS